MLTTTLRYLNSQQKGKHISIAPNSQLSKFVRKQQTPAELSWRKKMKHEWFFVTLAAALTINLVYNVFPNNWLSHNLFMWEEDSMAMGTKWEAEREARELKNSSD